MVNSLALKQDLILLPVVEHMTAIVMIVGVADDMIVAVEAVDGLIGVVVTTNDVTTGGVAIETKNNRKHKV
jgi:hypothetical protein